MSSMSGNEEWKKWMMIKESLKFKGGKK